MAAIKLVRSARLLEKIASFYGKPSRDLHFRNLAELAGVIVEVEINFSRDGL
jgi:hypothetical protein